jgi:two-component system sensor histidine kinase TctE
VKYLRSLRLELLVWLTLPLAAVVAVNIWTTYRSALDMADLITDRMLLASATAIAEQTQVNNNVVEALIPPVSLEMFDTGYGDRVYYRVETAEDLPGKGRLLAGYDDLPLPPREAKDPAARQADADLVSVGGTPYSGRYRNQRLHLMAIEHAVIGSPGVGAVRVMVGVTLFAHGATVQRLWLNALGQQVLLLAVAGALAIIGLARGLGPLMRLRDEVRNREPDQLEPFAPESVQSELRPLVAALNHHMDRVKKQMAAQRRFIANAAHQLRTPLTVLNMQATYALREDDAAERASALTAIQSGTRRLAHLAGQLLTLSRASPGSRRPRHDPVDLAAVARQVLESLSALAVERHIDLGLDGDVAPVVTGDETMLREMLVNLVDNALRYTPGGGGVTVLLAEDDDAAVIIVQDTGPGIPAAERDQVFERFYRRQENATPEHPTEGSGLGLAIVKEVVDAAGGTIALRDAAAGTGLVVEVRLVRAGAR